jgi:hypothetical protein
VNPVCVDEDINTVLPLKSGRLNVVELSPTPNVVPIIANKAE